MKPKIKKMWAEALRSRKYEQGIENLRAGDRFCCLGVLCDLHAKATGHRWVKKGKCYEYLKSYEILPEAVVEWAGLQNDNPMQNDNPIVNGRHLTSINDSGASFPEIANLIEQYL